MNKYPIRSFNNDELLYFTSIHSLQLPSEPKSKRTSIDALLKSQVRNLEQLKRLSFNDAELDDNITIKSLKTQIKLTAALMQQWEANCFFEDTSKMQLASICLKSIAMEVRNLVFKGRPKDPSTLNPLNIIINSQNRELQMALL